MRKHTWDDYKDKFQEVHKGLYEYDVSSFTRGAAKMWIKCPAHGWFEQKPCDHVRGMGCNRCGQERCTATTRLTREEFIRRSQEKHGNKFDYSMVDYKNNLTKVTIICPRHGEIEVRPSTHMRGVECNQCEIEDRSYGIGFYNKRFFEKFPDIGEKTAILYLIKLPDIGRIKMGITRQYDFEARFQSMRKKVGRVEELNLYITTAEDAFETESKLHKKYWKRRSKPDKKFEGWTECYPLELESTLMWEISDLIAEKRGVVK